MFGIFNLDIIDILAVDAAGPLRVRAAGRQSIVESPPRATTATRGLRPVRARGRFTEGYSGALRAWSDCENAATETGKGADVHSVKVLRLDARDARLLAQTVYRVL